MNYDRAERIRASVPLENVLLAHGVELKRTGNSYMALCIWHDETNPSMHVYQSPKDGYQRAFCFSCGHGGDVMDVYGQLNGLSVKTDFVKIMDALEGEILGNGKRFANIVPEKPFKRKPITFEVPPPDSLPPFNYAKIYNRSTEEWIAMGAPVGTWCFRTPDGKPWYYEARYELTDKETGEVKKEPRCWIYGSKEPMPPKWWLQHAPAPRPIYGLDKIAKANQVLIFEGARKAEYAHKILGIACSAWAGGANAVRHQDWSPLKDKNVVIVPDADDAGRYAAKNIAEHAHKVGAASIHIINVDDMPKGWDICDRADWTRESLVEFLRGRKTAWAQEIVEQHDMPPDYELPPIEVYEADYQQKMSASAPRQDADVVWCKNPVNIWDNTDLPEVTENMLPPLIWDYVSDRARIMGADPAMMALSAIVSIAGVIHDDIRIQPNPKNPEWTESARLWGAIVGDPSSKKSPIINQVTRTHRKIAYDLVKEELKIREEFKAEQAKYEAKKKRYIEISAKGEPANMPAPIEHPEIPRLLIENTTLDKAQEIASTTSRGLFMIRDELAEWIGSMDAYKSKGGSDRAAWLSSYNGGPLHVDRIGRGSIHIKNWSCSILGGIQNDLISRMAGSMTDDGLLQRFMIVCCNGKNENGSDETPDIELGKRYAAIIHNIFETTPAMQAVQLSPEAADERKFICDKARELIRGNYLASALVAHLGKWEGIATRMMLVYHVIDCACRRVYPSSEPVSGDTGARVRRYMLNHLLPHAVNFYVDVLGESKAAKAFKAICAWILAKNICELTIRNIDRTGPHAWRDLEDTQQRNIIVRLIEWGWAISPDPVDYFRKRPGRLLINPLVHEMFAEHKRREAERINKNHEISEQIKNGTIGNREGDF